jgi:ArsR family transcriptional regulator
MTPTSIATLEQLFRALSDATRLRILALVASGEICVCHIHEALDIPQPTASRHLAYLRRTRLVAARRDGLWVHYRLAVPADPAVAAVLRSAIDALRTARGVSSDRRQLSGLVRIPLRVLEERAACCVPAGQADKDWRSDRAST